MVRAHAGRTREFADLFGSLDQAILAAGTDGEHALAAHRALTDTVCRWIAADMRAEHEDLVSLTTEERAELQRAIRRLLPYVDEYAADAAAKRPDGHVHQALEQASSGVPTELPRAVLAKLRRCLARFVRLEALNAAEVFLHNEARLVSDVLDWPHDLEFIAPMPFEPDKGFESTFAWALDACVSREPTRIRARDIGLGEDVVQVRDLILDAESVDTLHERWLKALDPEHPWTRYPFVPRCKFACNRRDCLVRNYLEDTGPLGWAVGEELRTIAQSLRELSRRERAATAQLRALADRLEDAYRDGDAVLGWLEYLAPEAEGHRLWLVDSDEDTED